MWADLVMVVVGSHVQLFSYTWHLTHAPTLSWTESLSSLTLLICLSPSPAVQQPILSSTTFFTGTSFFLFASLASLEPGKQPKSENLKHEKWKKKNYTRKLKVQLVAFLCLLEFVRQALQIFEEETPLNEPREFGILKSSMSIGRIV